MFDASAADTWRQSADSRVGNSDRGSARRDSELDFVSLMRSEGKPSSAGNQDIHETGRGKDFADGFQLDFNRDDPLSRFGSENGQFSKEGSQARSETPSPETTIPAPSPIGAALADVSPPPPAQTEAPPELPGSTPATTVAPIAEVSPSTPAPVATSAPEVATPASAPAAAAAPEIAPPTPAPAAASTPEVSTAAPPTAIVAPTLAQYSATADLAAAETTSSMPASATSLNEVGATTTPAALTNPQDLAAVTVAGNSDITSALGSLGTLTDNDGTYTLNANGAQLPPLVLNNVSGLNITNANWADVSGSGAVTITGASFNDSITDSRLTNIGSGVDVYGANNIMPSGITIDGNYISNITGVFPSVSAVQFAGDGANETTAMANGIDSISHNTIIDGVSTSSPNITNPNPSGQDIVSDYNNPNVGGQQMVISGNSIDGAYTPADGSTPNDTAINVEISSGANPTWVTNNLVQNQSAAGIANDGSYVNGLGNYVYNAVSAYNWASEAGTNPTGEYSYNNSNITPEVPITSGTASNGWPEVYAPGGPPPGSNNNYNV